MRTKPHDFRYSRTSKIDDKNVDIYKCRKCGAFRVYNKKTWRRCTKIEKGLGE